jgi:hypothetical protein
VAVVTTPTVRAYFDLINPIGDLFTLDDPTLGQLDGVGVLGGDLPVDLTASAFSVAISRGRSRELDEFNTGTCAVAFRNYDRLFDPSLVTFEKMIGVEGYGVGDTLSTEDGFDITTTVATAYDGNIVPGKRITVDVDGVVLFDGTIDDWNHGWDVSGAAEASLTAIDALGDLARKTMDTWTATAGDLPGERLTAVLDRPEVAFAYNRDIGTGVSTLQADVVAEGANVLSYCQLVARSDLGRFYASRTNVLTFEDRHSLLAPEPYIVRLIGDLFTLDDPTFGQLDGLGLLAGVTATVALGDGGIPFDVVAMEFGAETLSTRVSVTRNGGTVQTSEDLTAQASYGVRALQVGGLLVDSDIQASDIADYLLGRYKTPVSRLSTVRILVHGLSDADAATALALDINNLVEVNWTPLSIGSPVSQLSVIEGMTHDISASGTHELVLRLGLVGEVGYFVLNDPILGVLDSSVLTF